MKIKKTVESVVAAISPTDAAAIERDLTKLEQRRAQLAESLDVATHSAISASASRRELIIANRDLEDANAQVRDAEETRVAIDDALRALDRQIIDATGRLAEAKDKAERENVARILAKEADQVEKASEALDKSTDATKSTARYRANYRGKSSSL